MDWKLKLDAEPQGSSNGFWYDLTDGGYIHLEQLIEDSEQLQKARDAVLLLHSLEVALANNELLNEF